MTDSLSHRFTVTRLGPDGPCSVEPDPYPGLPFTSEVVTTNALSNLWGPIEALRGHRVREQAVFNAAIDSILNRIRTALND